MPGKATLSRLFAGYRAVSRKTNLLNRTLYHIPTQKGLVLMKKVAVIHTSEVTLAALKELFAEILPDVEMINIVDDSLLAEVKRNGAITPDVTARVCAYARIAQSMGACMILNQCSSVGKACSIARKLISIPYLKIDEPMAEKAVSLGEKIAVIGTVASTMAPSCELVEEMAAKAGKNVTVTSWLVDGALDILMKEHDQEKHNQLVLQAIREAAVRHDVIVLAQGSMHIMEPYLKEISKPVLTSPRLAVERVRAMVDAMSK